MGELAETIDNVPVRLDEVGVVKAIERKWGSMEQLAHWLMVENPHLIESPPETVAAQAGLPKDVMRYLMNSSKQFLKLLDWHVANQSFSLADRAGAYRLIRQRMQDPKERLGDVIRAQDGPQDRYACGGREPGRGTATGERADHPGGKCVRLGDRIQPAGVRTRSSFYSGWRGN